MRLLRRLFGSKNDARARSPKERIDVALADERARYAELRESTAGCLYVVHKLRGEVARHQAIAAVSRNAARRALADKDVPRSRAMVARARTALDIAREADQQRAELRRNADAALESLRRLGETVGGLERDRLRALCALTELPAPSAELAGARRDLELLEAERELELELL